MTGTPQNYLEVAEIDEVSGQFDGDQLSTGNPLVSTETWSDEVTLPRVTLRQPTRLDTTEMVRLYHTIEEAVDRRPHCIIQVVGPTNQESNVDVAYELAWTGSALLGKRILFIDASQKAAVSSQVRNNPKSMKVLSEVASGSAQVEEAIAQSIDSTLCIATLQNKNLGQGGLVAAREVNGLLQELRQHFDLVIVAPTPVLNGPLAAVLTGFIDGSVLVLEAGKTQRGTTARSVEVLSSGGTPFLGAVLTKRRSYLPKWLARWF